MIFKTVDSRNKVKFVSAIIDRLKGQFLIETFDEKLPVVCSNVMAGKTADLYGFSSRKKLEQKLKEKL